MPWVADYTARIPPAALEAAGVVGVCRYLSYPVSSGKVIGQAEYDELRAADIEVVLNWEYDAHDWLGGASAGAAHGKEAARLAKALGHPAGSPIPGSADFDMTAGQWSSSCGAYAAAFRDALHAGGYAAAVYGPWDVLSRCRDLGGFAMFWQSMSTAHSGGRNADPWPGAHLRQRFKTWVAGHEVDHNDILRDDWAGDMAGLTDNQARALGNIENVVVALLQGKDANSYVTSVGAHPIALDNALHAAIAAIAPAPAPTQDQVDAAVAKVMGDPAWLAKLGAALASHIHVA